ncbi:MAG: hypothetical protein ACXVB1_07530 [Pseudobdellovibrionaceae bacterium]
MKQLTDHLVYQLMNHFSKSTILISFIFSLSPSQGWSAPALVDFTTYACTDVPCFPSSATSFEYSNVQKGNLLVVTTSTSSTGTCTISSNGELWSHDIQAASGIGDSLDIWSLPNAASGNKLINVNCTGGATSIRVLAAQYSGMATTNHVVDKSSNTGYGSNVSAGMVTTPTNNTLLFAATRTDSDLQGWAAGSGFTLINGCNLEREPDQKLCMEMGLPVSAGTYSGNFSITSDSWVSGIVAYAPAGEGGGATLPTLTAPANLRIL